MPAGRVTSPRLVVWLTGVSFTVIGGVLGLVFVLLSWQARSGLAQAASADLERSQQWFAEIEARRAREWRLQAMASAENPTLKAAVDTYLTESAEGAPPEGLLATIDHEVNKLADLLDADVLAVVDTDGRVLSAGGPAGPDWRRGQAVPGLLAADRDSGAAVVEASRLYLATSVPLVIGADAVGAVVSAVPLDDRYAMRLSSAARAEVLVVHDGRMIARSPGVPAGLDGARLEQQEPIAADGEQFVVRSLTSVGSTRVYAVSSVTQAAAATTAGLTRVLVGVGIAGLALAALASTWLARLLATPITRLTDALARMTEARNLREPLPPGGASQELDTLIETFGALRAAVIQAEDESEAAYVGVIGTLAAALDARDPYTAGHSQRVASLSVLIAEAMGMAAPERETLRLGALLHDIGKIGINDTVLRKPSRLTNEEFDHIKLHPVLGARILQPLAFLHPHIPVVELHHERPDGRGYPHGLSGDATPLAARIVHVADAFDAMTSARAYRRALPASHAIAELRQHAGTDFDPLVAEAMIAVWDTRLAPAGGVVPVDALPFRNPADYVASVRSRAAAREIRTVA
ncbi:MAG TPA: HD-GYP domain-containing protein [Vicinamibacterales bacterium]|nr:HD-GYP domain-containing protein [Vicinamibacterales bacterium]